MFRKIRITVLLYALMLVAGGAWLTRMRATDWDDSLWVLVYPINGDGSATVRKYLRELDRSSFAPLQAFFAEQTRARGLTVDRPFVINLAAELNQAPPLPPQSGQPLAVMWWSLKLRFWARQVERSQSEPSANIQVFVVYHDPEHRAVLPHSLGLQEGLIGVVHAFASKRMTQANNVVIAHELLHTVGATDKYDPSTGFPVHPDGFAEPDQLPLYPQRRAELMGGRIPIDQGQARDARSLSQVVVGPITAQEVNWNTGG